MGASGTRRYAPGTFPTYEFKLLPGALLCSSNETGFTQENVEALSRIGRSSKRDRESIGEKGVGWKSVYCITDEPHVLSKDHAFKFSKARELGKFLPTCLDEADIRSLPFQRDRSQTQFYLPFRNAEAAAKTRAEL